MANLIENLKAARRSGVPLIAITTMDQPATVDAIDSAINECPKVAWDCLNGLRPLNTEGKSAVAALGEAAVKESIRPALAMKCLTKIAANTIVFVYNGHAFLNEAPVLQGVQNLREAFKENKRMLVLLGPSFVEMPLGLTADVVTLEQPLPTDDELRKVITELHEVAKKPLDEAQTPSMIDAVRGLPALFTVEQVVAMSFRKAGLDMDALWERKVAAINSTKGLTISRGGLKYADLAGMDTVMQFLSRYQQGPHPARVILFWDEIEKMMAGAGGEQTDSSGVSSDFLNVCLKRMEDLGWAGVILFGVPGSGKTALADATSGEFGIPKIAMDFGAFKGRYVGDSESAVRTGFGVVESLGGADVLVIATCNRMKSLPPEFRRRFWLGNWYFDVPTVEEQEPIKRIYESKYKVKNADWPNTDQWTGAEIRNCARLTERLRCSLKEAGEYVVPIAKADPESLEALRGVADSRFLSVSYPGVWRKEGPAEVVSRPKRRQIGG